MDMDDEVLICRCQEVTRKMILDAIADGATTVDGIKRRTRAGMGLCQGKSCERLIQGILAEVTGQDRAQITVKIGIIGGADDE